MKVLITRKIGMSQFFGDNGAMTPVTLLEANPCVVTDIRTEDKDGYAAIQLGEGETKKPTKSAAGHLKKSKSSAKIMREFRIKSSKSLELKLGDKVDVSQFEPGDKVSLVAVSRGKGFAGTIKRHNFHRGPMTHGSRSKRRVGSIGSMYPQRIFKGKKMAGRMGHGRTSLRGVEVALADAAKQVLAVKGPVPGPKKGVVLVRAG